MLSKTSILAAAALAALLAAGPAAAQRSNWYIGGGVGQAQADFVASDFSPWLETGTYTHDDNGFAAQFFGGYRFAPHVAVEFGFSYLGQYQQRFAATSGVAIYNYDASALTVAIAGNLPIAGGLSLTGRAGVGFTAANLQLTVDNGTARIPYCGGSYWYSGCTSTSANFYWGLGAQLDVSPTWGLRFDYDNFGQIGSEFESGRADIDRWSVNVLYNF
jgi:opacity protein-like surface antigen